MLGHDKKLLEQVIPLTSLAVVCLCGCFFFSWINIELVKMIMPETFK